MTDRPTTPEEEPEATADSQAPAPPTGTPQDAEHARPEAAPEAGSGVGPEAGSDAGRPAPQAGGAEGGEEVDDLAAAEAEMDRARADVAALTQDLQRLQAEYVNYKRRVDRDRELVQQNATFTVLSALLPVLDPTVMGWKQRQSERTICCSAIRLINVCDMLWKLVGCERELRVQPTKTRSTSLAIDQVSERPDRINPSTFRERQ